MKSIKSLLPLLRPAGLRGSMLMRDFVEVPSTRPEGGLVGP